jgi:putative methyltransferase (TIGR04325 family)
MQLREFVPPIVFSAIRNLRHGATMHRSYRDAARACSNGGYQQDALLDIIYEKTRRHRDMLLGQKPPKVDLANVRTPLALSLARNAESLTVVDFGGACGAHYFTAKSLFGDRVKLSWYVVETEGMVKRGRRLENGELVFVDSLGAAKTKAGQPDLIFSSSTLQYMTEPYKTLTELTACHARNIFLTRLGLTTAPEELFCVQKSPFRANGPGPLPAGMKDGVARYPMTVLRKDRVEQILDDSYEIRMQLDEDQGAYWLTGKPIDMYGYFGELRTRAG